MVLFHAGNNVARLRGFRRLAQKEVAGKLNMSQQEYSKIEARPVIDDDLLQRIAEVIDFPIELIKQLDAGVVIQNYQQQGGTSENITANTFNQNNTDKVTELLERLLKEKDEVIQQQANIIKQKDQVIEMYQKQLKAS